MLTDGMAKSGDFVAFSNDFSGETAEAALSNSSSKERDADDFCGVVKFPSASAGPKGSR